MAFITQRERDTLVKKTQKSYKGRKIFFLISIALTLAWMVLLVVLTFLAEAGVGSFKDAEGWFKDGKITALGGVAIAITAVLVILDVVSLILMLTVVSPKDSVKTAKKLQSSAISGVKTSKSGIFSNG